MLKQIPETETGVTVVPNIHCIATEETNSNKLTLTSLQTNISVEDLNKNFTINVPLIVLLSK